MNEENPSWRPREGETEDQYVARHEESVRAERRSYGQQYCALCGNMICWGFGACQCGKACQPRNY